MTSPETLTPQRPGASDAVIAARRYYLAGERIDMGTIAADLGVGRTTLYRWVGDRETLIAEMLSEMVPEVVTTSVQEARGVGVEAVVDGMHRFMETSLAYTPLRTLVEREPELALRVMIAPNAGVSVAIRRRLAYEIGGIWPEWTETKTEDLADVIVQIGMAYQWGNVAVNAEPDVDRALKAVRMLVEAAVAAPVAR